MKALNNTFGIRHKSLIRQDTYSNLTSVAEDAKDRPLNYSLILGGGSDSSVVPLWQEFVKEDGHVVLEISGHFATGLIDAVNLIDRDREALAGLGLGDELRDQFTSRKDDALTGAGDMREEPVFNRVVLGAIGRIMSDADFNADFIDQRL